MKKRIKLSNNEIGQLSNAPQYSFPKYATQIINLANGNAQGTRPSVVGQMSELIKQFGAGSLEEWVVWYSQEQPDSVKEATDRIYSKFIEMRKAADLIDRDMIESWVKDLVFTKTYCGLKFQGAVLSFLANEVGKSWRLANVEEERKGIDGYVGSTPVQVKPVSFKQESHLREMFEAPIVYYEKRKDGIVIEFDPDEF